LNLVIFHKTTKLSSFNFSLKIIFAFSKARKIARPVLQSNPIILRVSKWLRILIKRESLYLVHNVIIKKLKKRGLFLRRWRQKQLKVRIKNRWHLETNRFLEIWIEINSKLQLNKIWNLTLLLSLTLKMWKQIKMIRKLHLPVTDLLNKCNLRPKSSNTKTKLLLKFRFNKKIDFLCPKLNWITAEEKSISWASKLSKSNRFVEKGLRTSTKVCSIQSEKVELLDGHWIY
jgi:hypothetical protein